MKKMQRAIHVAAALVTAAAVASARVEATFDGNGLVALAVDGKPLLQSGALTLRRVVATDTYRNRNAEDDAAMYRPETRTFRELRVIPFEHHFEPAAKRLIQMHEWGQLTADYVVGSDRLDVRIELRNTGDDVIEHVALDLLALNLPGEVTPRLASGIPGFMRSNCNLEAPDLWQADYDGGRLVFASLRPEEPLQQRFMKRDGAWALTVAAGSADGGREVFDTVWDVRPLRPGESDRYWLSLRFGGSASSPFELARDVLEAYGKAIPSLVTWPDRRPILCMHVADARRDKANPRGWKQAVNLPATWNVLEDEGHAVFRKAVMAGAERAVAVARRSGAQGLIVWQIEGMQEPGHSYYGEPRILPYTAPEMDALADDYFRVFREAGLRVGVTLRPVIQVPFDPKVGEHKGELLGVVGWPALREAAIRADWSVQFRNIQWVKEIPEPLRDLYAADEAWSMLLRLDSKIRYAKKRWNATLFYLDANNAYRPRLRGETLEGWDGRPLPGRLIEELRRRHPDCLIIAEHQSFRYWTSGAQYLQPPHFGQRVTPEEVRIAYPEAMSVIAAVAAESMFLSEDQFPVYIEGILSGDTLLTHGWYGGHYNLIDKLFGPAALAAPFHVYVGRETLQLNGEAVADAAALQAALARKITVGAALKQRRVYVGYDEAVPYVGRVIPVLDAVTTAGGIIAWTQPKPFEALRDAAQ